MMTKPCAADFAAIMELMHDAQAFMAQQGIDQWREGYPSEQQIRDDIEAERALVLMEGGKALCYAVISFELELWYEEAPEIWGVQGKYAVLHRMAVASQRRGTGLASELMTTVIQKARERGMAVLRTDTHRGNMPMQRFLSKTGFTRCGEVVYRSITDADPIRVAYELKL